MDHEHGGHRERLRKKFLVGDVDSFEEHEILELALFYAIPRKNTNDIAHGLLKKFGSLSAVFDAPIRALKDVKGMGESAAVFVKLISSLSRVYYDKKYNQDKKCLSMKELGNLLVHKFIGRNEEAVAIVLLDAKGKILFDGIINKGSVNGVDLYVRKMIELVTMYNASSLVMAHNHPSGIAVPSPDDLKSTGKISDLFRSMRVSVLDHIIVADNDYISLRENFPEFFSTGRYCQRSN